MQPILCVNELFYGKVCEAIMYSPFKVPEAIRISNMYSLFCVHHPHDYTFEGEVHDFWECLFVVSGELRVVGDERVYILKENDFIIHKPLELHKFTVLSESGAEVFIFSFDAVGALLKAQGRSLKQQQPRECRQLSNQRRSAFRAFLYYVPHGRLFFPSFHHLGD